MSSTTGREVAGLAVLASRAVERLLRKRTGGGKEPGTRALVALGGEEAGLGVELAAWLAPLPGSLAADILHRVLSYTGETERTASPLDVWALMQPAITALKVRRGGSALPGTHQALLDCLHRLPHLHHLDLAGLAAAPEFQGGAREHYQYLIADCVSSLPSLATLDLASLASNLILRQAANTCRGLRVVGVSGSEVTDLGVRYLAGLAPTAQQTEEGGEQGCKRLHTLDLTDVTEISLHTLSLLLLHLPRLVALLHNNLHQALWLMAKTGMDCDMLGLQLGLYRGREAAQCSPDHLAVLANLCPRIARLELAVCWSESLEVLSRFRHISHLCLGRLPSVQNLELPLRAFGSKLVTLELTNIASLQSGTALAIRKECSQLVRLRLEVDTTAETPATSQAGLQDQNLASLELAVSSLQERLSSLQGTMMQVMDHYGDLGKLESLQLRNVGMGSLLILLPYCPALVRLSLRYSLRQDEAGPSLTDSLFTKIFTKNPFSQLEVVEVWCRSLSIRTAEWFVRHCPRLSNLRSLSAWNTNEEEQVALWREGRRREPRPVEIDF